MRNTSLENLIFTVAPILLDKLEQMDGRTNTTKAKRGRVGSNVKGQKKNRKLWRSIFTYYFTIVHPIEGSRDYQIRWLMNEIVVYT